MFWKLSLLVLTIGGAMCGLLVLRQKELDLQATRIDIRRDNFHRTDELRLLRHEIDQLAKDEIIETWAERNGLDLEPISLAPMPTNSTLATALGPTDTSTSGEPGG